MNGTDLSGEWEVCSIDPQQSSEVDLKQLSSCNWQPIVLPQYSNKNGINIKIGNHAIRKKFTAPEFCLSSEKICNLLIGEMDGKQKIYLNGNLIGEHGSASDKTVFISPYPLYSSISVSSLRVAPEANTLVIITTSLQPWFIRVIREPMVIVDSVVGLQIVESLIAEVVVLRFAERYRPFDSYGDEFSSKHEWRSK